MKLLTETQRKKLIDNHNKQDGTKSFKVVVKLFDPQGSGTWFLTELNPDTNIAFGLCHITEAEIGYVDLDELQSYKGVFGLGIERDKFWPTGKTIAECKEAMGW